MHKKLLQGTISLFILLVVLTQVLTPSQAFAGALNWDNPNGYSPFKPKAADLLNPQLLTSVVGCTGVVNKVAVKIVKLENLVNKSVNEIRKRAFLKVCKDGKKVVTAGTAATASTVVGTGTPVGLALARIVADQECSGDSKTFKPTPDAVIQEDSKAKVEQCFNGIAITLAKNQLTAMTKSTLNWVNTGLNGDPFFVRNANDLLDGIQKNLLEQEVGYFSKLSVKNGVQYPYASDYARSQVNTYNIKKDQHAELQSDLSSFVTGSKNSTDATNKFAKDFSSGGWSGWLALTQHEQNNPLGFTMKAVENLAAKEQKAIETKKAEIANNNGYQDQKKCVAWNRYDEVHDLITDKGSTEPKIFTSGKDQVGKGGDANGDICVKFETITPGSTIRDKVGTTTGTPERQLEMVRTINDALNSLFSSLLNQLFNQGLTGLSSVRPNNFTSISNITTKDLQIGSAGSASSPSTYNPSVGLGNKYTEAVNGGTWDARNNIPALSSSVGTKNTYYTVSVSGDTRLSTTSHYWVAGEKAFYDGTTWRVGVPKYVVDTRGGIQMQYDFNANARAAIKLLPQVTPALGELDWCIPGPNSNWSQNSADIRDAFSNYVDGIYTKTADRKVCDKNFCITKHTESYPILSLPPPVQYQSYFTSLPDLWAKIVKSELFTTNIPLNAEITSVISDTEKEYIQKTTDTLWSEYTQKINALYGTQGIMQNELLYDAQGNVSPNTGYLPMATTGLTMTRDIVEQANEIDNTVRQYQDDIAKNNANIYKLTVIKDQINAIVVAAQSRRASSRKAAGLPSMPQVCLNNEKITYVVNDEIK